MRLNLPLLAWGLRRLIAGRGADLLAAASRSWEVSPPERAAIPPALHLPDAMDHVGGLSPWRDWSTERALIAGGTIEHGATTAHLLEGIDVRGPYLYRGAAKALHGFGPKGLVLRGAGPARRIDAAHLVSNWAGSAYFGNCVSDMFTLQLLAPTDAPPVVLPYRHYEHEAGYRDLLSLPRPPCVEAARIGALTIYTDFAQNGSKARRYRELRGRMGRALGGAARPPPAGVYLKRGATGERRVVANEAEVERTLRARGFDVVEPALLAPDEIARRMLGAPVIVGVEGSHLGHFLYTIGDGGTLVVLQPPDRFAMDFKEFTDRLEMRFAFVVGRAAPDGFTVETAELERVLDLVR